MCYQLSYNDLLNMCSFHYLNYIEIYKAGRQKVKEKEEIKMTAEL